MTVFPLLHPRALALLALSLMLAATTARAVDDPGNLGGLNLPNYLSGQGGSGTGRGGLGAGGSGLRGQADTSSGSGTGTQPGWSNRLPAPPPPAPATDANNPRRADLPAPKPSEFQKFVEAATGRLLPLFGSSFFSATADSFAPVDNVPVSADYTVGPGDEIVLRAWGSIDVDYRSTVDRNGMLNLPKVGSFSVAGVKASELENHLRAQIGRLFTNFNLSVSLGQLRGVKVFVVGPAQRPGVYTLNSQATLLSAVVAAGGPAPSGSMRKILLRRDGRVISELDVYEFLVQGDKSKDVQLAPGDVVVFQPGGARVALTGALDTPAIFELKTAQAPLREVLRYAGGAQVLVNLNRAQLERVDPAQTRAARFVEEFRLDGDSLQKPLRDGDVLTLLAISPQFANAVTLKGHVAQPLRYPYKPGMRIHDLIPDRDALISADYYRRKNLLVQVIDDDDGRGGSTNNNANSNNNNGNNAGSGNNNGSNPSNGSSNATGMDPNAQTGARLRQDRGDDRLAPDRGTTFDRSGRDRDGGNRAASDRAGSDRDPGARNTRPPTTLFDELNWDYAVIERLNERDLTTQVIPFNLGRVVLQNDEASNLELLPGDVVTIYGQQDIRVPVARQTRLVSLEGEVGAPGVYQLQPGETLRGLIARAGGFTPQAYVYGLEFSREETRQRQRENLASAIARLETLSAVQAARDAANRRDDTSALAASAVSNAATQAQLSRLARIEPNGRIALELNVDTRTLDALPDVPLDRGDHISVPTRPGFVTVAGAVVNGNAFLWKPGRTAGDYLRLAGPDEASDTSNMFILRADGTVSHAGDYSGFFRRNNLESQLMNPGDSLIVPNQLDFETWGRALVRNLKDWSQIFSQFGLGIAAIHSLNK